MFEKREIINAIEIAKEQHLEKLSSFDFELFLKSAILNILNKMRWYQGASEHEGTFMTEEQFEKIIQNRKFFSTPNYVGLKSKNPIINTILPKRKEIESFLAQIIEIRLKSDSRISHNNLRIPNNKSHNNKQNSHSIIDDSRISKKQSNKNMNLQEGPNY